MQVSDEWRNSPRMEVFAFRKASLYAEFRHSRKRILGGHMPGQPTTADAELILKLYELRREGEMRKARAWFAGWWPRGADAVVEMITAPPNPMENAWFRQVSGYWDMAASFVLRGVLNEELFFDSGGEMWFTLAKVYPFLKEVREKAQVPYLFQRVEKVATASDEARERLQMMLKRAEARRAAMAKAS